MHTVFLAGRRFAGALLLLVAVGCGGGPPPVVRIDAPDDWEPITGEDIRLGVGDVFELSYFKSYVQDSVYRLEPGDRIQVVVDTQNPDQPYVLSVGDKIQVSVKSGEMQGPYRILRDGTCTLPLLGAVRLEGLSLEGARSELQSLYRKHYTNPTTELLVTESSESEVKVEVTVLPDGSCTLPVLGVVPVGGRTVVEAAGLLTQRYGEHYRQPRVDLLVMESRERLDDFFSVLLRSQGGPFQQVVITSEGVLELPLIAPIRPLNRTLQEVREEIRAAYREVLPNVAVDVNLVASSTRQFAVMGEVEAGGVFDAFRPVSPMAAIAMAGGFTRAARRDQVVLVHMELDGALTVRTLDLRKGLSMEDPSIWNIKVQPFDLVYVPISRIANMNLFVRQYITDLIPVQFRIGVGIEYQVQSINE